MKNLIIVFFSLIFTIGHGQITMTDLRADEIKYGETVMKSVGGNMNRAEIVIVDEYGIGAKAYLFQFKNEGLPLGLGRIVGPYLETHGSRMENGQIKANQIIKATADTSARCKSLPIVFGEYRACWNGTYRDYYAQRENCELCPKEIIEFEYGIKNGWSNKFYENGDTQSTMYYEKGLAVGQDREYYPNGILQEKRVHNGYGRIVEYVKFWENGNLKSIENTEGRMFKKEFNIDGFMYKYFAQDSVTIYYEKDGSKQISTQNNSTKIWEKNYYNPKGELIKKDIYDPAVEFEKNAYLRLTIKNGKTMKTDTVPHAKYTLDEGKEQQMHVEVTHAPYSLPYYGLSRVGVSKLLEPISEKVKVKKRDEGVHSLQIAVDEKGKATYSWQGNMKWTEGKLATEILNTLQNELHWEKGYSGVFKKGPGLSAVFVMDLSIKCKK